MSRTPPFILLHTSFQSHFTPHNRATIDPPHPSPLTRRSSPVTLDTHMRLTTSPFIAFTRAPSFPFPSFPISNFPKRCPTHHSLLVGFCCCLNAATLRPQYCCVAVFHVICIHHTIVVLCRCGHCRIRYVATASYVAVRNLEHCTRDNNMGPIVKFPTEKVGLAFYFSKLYVISEMYIILNPKPLIAFCIRL